MLSKHKLKLILYHNNLYYSTHQDQIKNNLNKNNSKSTKSQKDSKILESEDIILNRSSQ